MCSEVGPLEDDWITGCRTHQCINLFRSIAEGAVRRQSLVGRGRPLRYSPVPDSPVCFLTAGSSFPLPGPSTTISALEPACCGLNPLKS